MDAISRDPQKKINLEVTADQINDIGNCVAIILAIGQRKMPRAMQLMSALLNHTSPEELFKLGQYLTEVAEREDPVISTFKRG